MDADKEGSRVPGTGAFEMLGQPSEANA